MDCGVIGVSGVCVLWFVGEEDGLDFVFVIILFLLMEDCWDEKEGVGFGEGGWFFMGGKCVFLEIVDYVLFG